MGAGAAWEDFKAVFDAATCGYAILERGVIREVNASGARLLGTSRATMLGERFDGYIAADARCLFDQVVTSAHLEPGPVRIELDLCTNRPAIVTVTALVDAPSALLVAYDDISEHAAMAEALVRTEDALREATMRNDDILAMLAHELRNPLSPLRTSIDVLRMAPAPETRASALDIIDRAAAHLERVVDDLVDVTRISHGKVMLRRAPQDLVHLVRGVVLDRRDLLGQAGIAMTLEAPDAPIWVLVDRERVAQVLSNVLDNAGKFTPRDGAVRVTVEEKRSSVIIRVVDTGIGIPPEVLATVFEPFAQGPQELDREHGGLGLGLAAARGLVEQHDGWMTIASDGPGAGTEVTIGLPLAAAPALRQRQRTLPPVPQRRILIIEDKRDVAESLKYALTLKGHVVEAAFDGQSACALASAFQPQVVLCDLGLPDMDGYAVARRFREDPVLANTLLVALSGYTRPEDVAKARAAGFSVHLPKPPQLDAIDRVLADVEKSLARPADRDK